MKSNMKCGASPGHPQEIDELLEKIWTQRENGKNRLSDLQLDDFLEEGERWVQQLVKERLVILAGDCVVLTPAGEREAEQIIRRHRLTERLFADVFETSEEVWEREACELEHKTVLTDEAVSAICAFLGHPPTCPHGRAIPPGACCSEFTRELKPFVIPLSEACIASAYRIVFITPKNFRRLDRLAVLGILPGSEVWIHQKKPSYVIRIGETDVALDPEVVKDIYVKEMSPEKRTPRAEKITV